MSETAAHRVAQILRHDILIGRYRAGDRLRSERELAEQFDVHRGAIREGLRTLAQQGLIEISAAGPRVGRIEHASMDVIGDLLNLHGAPDLRLADQVLEVSTLLFSSCVALAVERGSNEQLGEVCAHLGEAQRDDLTSAEYLAHVHGMVDGLVDASGNFVLRLMSQALKLQFWRGLEARLDVALRLPPKTLAPLARAIATALEARDAISASASVSELMTAHRERVIQLLTDEQKEEQREAPRSVLDGVFADAGHAGSTG